MDSIDWIRFQDYTCQLHKKYTLWITISPQKEPTSHVRNGMSKHGKLVTREGSKNQRLNSKAGFQKVGHCRYTNLNQQEQKQSLFVLYFNVIIYNAYHIIIPIPSMCGIFYLHLVDLYGKK